MNKNLIHFPSPQRKPPQCSYPEPEWETSSEGAEATLRTCGRAKIVASWLVTPLGTEEAAYILAGSLYEALYAVDDPILEATPHFKAGGWIFRIPPKLYQGELLRLRREGLSDEESQEKITNDLVELGTLFHAWLAGTLFIGTLQFSLVWADEVIATVSHRTPMPFHEDVEDAESRTARMALRDVQERLFRDGTRYLQQRAKQAPRRAKSRRARSPRKSK